ncbi:MAG: tRNA (adenosine(37)-N6)-threonylcarbamoyltransferase complex ATPase subunit type 1 TsaE, partial [Planctomycetota bacterium]|nr:tRNA (adenosine(37)-N6)-threonylcarbamoyltransferase complex ATPase subunit type 1 TsaE [Planctomycetota bacterium]
LDVLQVELPDEDATLRLGRAIGAAAEAGSLVALSGDLGAGKTTLVRGLADGLGVPGTVSSPTYTLMQLHEGGRLPLSHFDAWMEGREKAYLADGADELLATDGVAVIEWAERVEEWLPEERLGLELLHGPDGGRSARLIAIGGAHSRILGEVRAELGLPAVDPHG